MASVIGKDSFTLAEFLASRDFILCNNAANIIIGATAISQMMSILNPISGG